METHHEIVTEITERINDRTYTGWLRDEQKNNGFCAFYDVAEMLTDEFENKFKGREWDGEFWDEIEKFSKEKLDQPF
jgi:hypothetical protein